MADINFCISKSKKKNYIKNVSYKSEKPHAL